MMHADRDFEHAQLSKVWGKYAGSVADNDDPQKMGRLQVRCQAVLGSGVVWAMPCVPYAGKGVGLHFLPPKDAGVWVEFEGGDVSRPIWTGCYWAKGDLPSVASSADIKVIVTAKASLEIDDGAGEVTLKNQDGASVTLNSKVEAAAGGATHTVGAAGVTSEAGAGKLEVTPASVSAMDGAFSVF